MGTIKCYVCPRTWEELGKPNGIDFCSVDCFKRMYEGKDKIAGDLYNLKLRDIKERVRKNGIKF